MRGPQRPTRSRKCQTRQSIGVQINWRNIGLFFWGFLTFKDATFLTFGGSVLPSRTDAGLGRSDRGPGENGPRTGSSEPGRRRRAEPPGRMRTTLSKYPARISPPESGKTNPISSPTHPRFRKTNPIPTPPPLFHSAKQTQFARPRPISAKQTQFARPRPISAKQTQSPRPCPRFRKTNPI